MRDTIVSLRLSLLSCGRILVATIYRSRSCIRKDAQNLACRARALPQGFDKDVFCLLKVTTKARSIPFRFALNTNY